MLGSIASVALVLGLLAGLLWWLRRVAGGGGAAGRHIRVIETVSLGPNRSLHLVKVGGRGLLIASSPEHCGLISELAEFPEEMRPS